jgi:hypothetical protein
VQEKKVVQIDGDEYELTQLGAIEGRRLLTRILKFAGPAIQSLAASETLSEISFAAALAKAVEQLDEDTVDMLCEKFAAKTCLKIDNRWPPLDKTLFDQHFAGHYMKMMKWLGECMKLNFADFLSVLPVRRKEPQAAVAATQ